MPLNKLMFKPGISSDTTPFSNEGGFVDGDKIRFKNGYPDLAFPPKGKLKGKDAAMFNSIYTEWIKRIDYAQKIKGEKLTLKEKRRLKREKAKKTK